MGALFSPDSKLMQAMGRLGDLVVLNLLFLCTCLPIFTIGAASTALYTVCFQIGTEREGSIFREYVRSFRENFRQSTILFLILAPLVLAGAFNTALLFSLGGAARYGCILAAIPLVLSVLIYGYTFPLLSRFSNSTRATLKNALFLSLGYLPRSLLISILNIFPSVLIFLDLYLFLQMGFLWLFFYYSAAAYLNALLLRKVFAGYL